MAHRFRRQEKAVMHAIKPHIERQLLLHPVREAITPQGRTFASALLPKTLQPLSFAASPSETSEYNDAITDLIAGAASTLAKDLGNKAAGAAQSVASRYLHDNSLSKLTGDLDETSVERLQDALATAWDKGGDFDSMVKAVTDTFEDFSTTRAELIAATEANDAYSEGREATARQMGMGQKRWNVGSDGCPVCQENEDQGWIDIDDVFPSGDAAPTAHPNCFLGSTPIVAFGVSYAVRRSYEGEICVLRFAGLPDLAVTPNHPILRVDGKWCAAIRLEPGDHVCKCIFPSAATPVADPHFDHVEATIEQIFNSFSVSGSVIARGVPVAPEAFHGDSDRHTKIDVVRADRSCDMTVSAIQDAIDVLLMTSQRRRVSLNRDSAAAQILETALAPSHRIVSGSCLFRAGGGSGVGIAEKLRLTRAPLSEAHFGPSVGETAPTDANPSSYRENCLTGYVGTVELLEIERRGYTGHVYNLTTKSGIYFAGSIVAHNCDCDCDYRTGSAEE
jgi:hypothetical protein